MTIKLVTDSASDLSKSTAENLGISVIPLYINIGDESYLDGIDITRKEFYERLPVMESPPTTSAPGIATFVKIYQTLMDEGATGIVSVHVASNLSNVHNVAKLAAESIKDFPIEVIDGGNLSLGTGLLTMIGNSVAAADKSMEEVVHTNQGDDSPYTHHCCAGYIGVLAEVRPPVAFKVQAWNHAGYQTNDQDDGWCDQTGNDPYPKAGFKAANRRG